MRREGVYLKTVQRFAQIRARRMKLMELHTAEPAVDTSREEHGADLLRALPEFPNSDAPGPELPPTASRHTVDISYASEPAPQLSNGPILHVSLSMDIRVSQKYDTYQPVRLLTIAVCFSRNRRK